METINWNARYDNIKQYLKNGKTLEYYEFPKSKFQILVEEAFKEQKKRFFNQKHTKRSPCSTVFMWHRYLLSIGK